MKNKKNSVKLLEIKKIKTKKQFKKIMFHDERGLSSIHLKKSSILNLLGFLQAMGFSIALFISPLYLFEIFQSGETVGTINSIAAGFGIITTLLISVLLGKFSRGILFKFSIFSIFLSLILFTTLSNFTEALGARTTLLIGGVILGAVLSLYLKNISDDEKSSLAKNQGIFQVSKNIAWLISPVIAGFLFNFIENNKEMILEKSNFLPDFLYNSIIGNGKYLEYNVLLYIAIFFIFLTLIVFLWAKFINNHPHLQIQKNENEINMHHHYSNFKFILDFFKNKYRTFSFLNILFLSIWFSTFYGFGFTIFLESANLPKTEIGLAFGMAMLPLTLFEGLLGKIIKKLGGSINSLILAYGITIFFLIFGIIFGRENIYIFITFFILAHIGISISDPLQEYQYFEGTNKEEESKFYSIHMIGGGLFKLITPFLFGLGITAFGIQNTFYSAPVILLIFLLILIIYKLKFEKISQ